MPVSDPTKKSKSASLLRSGAIVSSMTFLSRILGFIRDQVFAIVFGAGPLTDAFFVAFKIPNFMRRLFAEGAFAQAFVPVFTEYKETRSPEALKNLASHVAGTLGTVLLAVTTLGVSAAPLFIMLFAPGFIDDEERYTAAHEMLRITFPYLLFISLTAYAGSMLNSFGRFAVPALTPVLLNVCMIASALWLAPMMETPIMGLAWGVFIAGLVQLLFQLPFLAQIDMLTMPRWGWRHEGVRKIFKLMIPTLIGSSVAQINLLLDTLIASMLMAGSISWLYYADRLVEFPLGIFGVALSTIILPRLSSHHAKQSQTAFTHTLNWALRIGMIIALPAMLGLLYLAYPILATLFQYGAFSTHDTAMASYSLMAYSLGLPAFIFIKILTPGFFARQDTKTPVKIGITALISNMAYNILLVVPMVYFDFIAPHVGLALATGMSAWQQAFMLFRSLQREKVLILEDHWKRSFTQVAISLAIMLASLLLITPENSYWDNLQHWERAITILGIISVAAVSYLISLWITGVRPADFKAH